MGEGAAGERVVVVVPVVDVRRLAGVLALSGVEADVAPLPGRGCLVALPEAPDAADRGRGGRGSGEEGEQEDLAAGVSRALRSTVVLALRCDVGAAGSGSVRVERWERGERVHGADVERSPGLVLAGLPGDAERVVHGSARVADLDGATTSVGLGRLEAARLAAGRDRGGRGPDAAPPTPRTSWLVPAVLAGAGLLVLLLEAVQLLLGGGSALVAAVGFLAVVVGTSTALRRRAAAREGGGSVGTPEPPPR
ncbi:hypothetical protein WDZ17_04250 [Pseudokineococcus basanitobsidens]|uniref:Uncharacterized protein n=1 Tax=Pseudokineococcus basanitobsidens TaxID=1926649 RepID=A0ABU8RHJ7_9ACTN